MTLPRVVAPEALDELAPGDPAARRSRRDLRRIHLVMGTRGLLLRALRADPGRGCGTAPLRILELGAGDGTLLLGVARALGPAGLGPVSLTLLDRQAVVEPATLSEYGRAGWQAQVCVADVLTWAAPPIGADDAASGARGLDAGALGAGALGTGAFGDGAFGDGAFGDGAFGDGAFGDVAFGDVACGDGGLDAGAMDVAAPGAGAIDAAPYDLIVANLFLHHFEGEALDRLLAAVAARARRFIACEPRRSRLALVASRLVGLIGANAVTRQDAVLSVHAGFRDGELSARWPADGGRTRRRARVNGGQGGSHASEAVGWALREAPAGLFSHWFEAVRRDAVARPHAQGRLGPGVGEPAPAGARGATAGAGSEPLAIARRPEAEPCHEPARDARGAAVAAVAVAAVAAAAPGRR